MGLLDKLDDNIWMTALKSAIVNKDETITFNFIEGKSIMIYEKVNKKNH